MSLTWRLFKIDPLSPYIDRKNEAVGLRDEYGAAFSEYDGVVAEVARTEKEFNALADDAEENAKTAREDNDQAGFEVSSSSCGQYRDAAKQFKAMREDLTSVRDDLKRLYDACNTVVAKIDTDLTIARKQWAIQGKIERINNAARRLFQGTELAQLAADADRFIKDKYASEFGKLYNLRTISEPLLKSIDLKKRSYSRDLLQKWKAEPKLIIDNSTQQVVGQIPAVVGSDLSFERLFK